MPLDKKLTEKAVEYLGNLPNNPMYQNGELIYPPRGLHDISKLMAAFAQSLKESK